MASGEGSNFSAIVKEGIEVDQLITNNDNRVDIDFVSVDNNLLKFKEPNGKEILSISVDRVASVVSRFGEIIYP